MAATITPLLTEIYDADTWDSDWTGTTTPDVDTELMVEGNASLSDVVRNTKKTYYYTPPSGAIDLRNTHIYCWFYCSTASALETKALGGVSIHVRDGSGNWGEWYVDGGDTYGGGWKGIVQRTSAAFDNNGGTDPDLSDIVSAGMAFDITTLVANKNNVWFDVMRYGSGLRITGGTSGSPGTFDDIASEDLSYAYGVVSKTSGIYAVSGELVFGEVGEDVYFTDYNQVIAFQNQDVDDDLYKMVINTSGSDACHIQLGDAIGTGESLLSSAPLNIRADSEVTYKLDFSCPYMDSLKLYGLQTYRANSILLGDSTKQLGGTVEIVDCSFATSGSDGRVHRNVQSSAVMLRNSVPFAPSPEHALCIFDDQGHDQSRWKLIGGYGLDTDETSIQSLNYESLQADQDITVGVTDQIWNFINPSWGTAGSPGIDWEESTGDVYEKFSLDYLIQTPAGDSIAGAYFLIDEEGADTLENEFTSGSTGLVSENVVTRYWYDETNESSYGPFTARVWAYDKNPFEAAITVDAAIDGSIALTPDAGVELTQSQAQAVTGVVVTAGSHGAQGKVWYYQIDCGNNDLDDVYSWLADQYVTSGSAPWLQDLRKERTRLMMRTGNTYYTEAVETHGVYIKNWNIGNVEYLTADDGTKYYPPVQVAFSLTNLVPGTEVGIYKDSDQSELYHQETSGSSATYPYTWSEDIPVYVQIHSVQYESITMDNIVLGNSDQSIPVSQQYDRNYENP